MDTSFFSGSENLYKYLATIGFLIMAATVYYPLKEKQELEILTIKLKGELTILNYKIKENEKNAIVLNNTVSQKGHNTETNKIQSEIYKLHQENIINNFESKRKYEEILRRRKHISQYNLLFWALFPIGFLATVFGFIRWIIIKRYDDNILKLQSEKLELEVKKIRGST